MKKGGVADHGDHTRFFAFDHVENLLRTVPQADAGTHTDRGFHGVIGCAGGKRVAADIARNHDILAFTEFIEKPAVGTASTQCGWSGNHSCL